MSDVNEIWKYIATTSLGIIISAIGFWITIAKNTFSKNEILEMIENKSPYLPDRRFIMERLAVNKETQVQFSLILQKNTEIMNELKIQLVTLGKTLEALEEKIENKLS